MRKAMLVCLAGAIWLLSFGFAGPFNQAPDIPPGKAKAEKAKSDAPLVKAQAKLEKVVEKKKPAPVKAKAKVESKTPVADLLNAVVEGVIGDVANVAVGAARMAPAAAMVQQVEQQYAARFRQLYRSEMHFMRIVCQPTRQQYEKILAAGDPEVKASIKKFALMTAEQRQGRFRADAPQPDSRKLIARAITNLVKVHLSSEQAARYEKELDERDVARRRVVLLNLLSGIDKKVVLTAEQRDKLQEILDKNWHDSWNQTQLLMQGGQFFPVMPDDKILPVLTDTQKNVWRKVQKGNVFFGSDLDMFQGIEMEDEVWSEPGAKK